MVWVSISIDWSIKPITLKIGIIDLSVFRLSVQLVRPNHAQDNKNPSRTQKKSQTKLEQENARRGTWKKLTPKHYTSMRTKTSRQDSKFTSSFSSAVNWRACCPPVARAHHFPALALERQVLEPLASELHRSVEAFSIRVLCWKFVRKNWKFHLVPWRWSESERRGSALRIQGPVHLLTLEICYLMFWLRAPILSIVNSSAKIKEGDVSCRIIFLKKFLSRFSHARFAVFFPLASNCESSLILSYFNGLPCFYKGK